LPGFRLEAPTTACDVRLPHCDPVRFGSGRIAATPGPQDVLGTIKGQIDAGRSGSRFSFHSSETPEVGKGVELLSTCLPAPFAGFAVSIVKRTPDLHSLSVRSIARAISAAKTPWAKDPDIRPLLARKANTIVFGPRPVRQGGPFFFWIRQLALLRLN